MQIAFGRELKGLEVCARALSVKDLAPVGDCAYCRQRRKLVETLGPLGLGGIFICRDCAVTCITFVMPRDLPHLLLHQLGMDGVEKISANGKRP